MFALRKDDSIDRSFAFVLSGQRHESNAGFESVIGNDQDEIVIPVARCQAPYQCIGVAIVQLESLPAAERDGSGHGPCDSLTPAGTFPAALMRSEFDIKIGPAKVTDVQYSFFAKGVGKVAEIEALKVSALLIYHSHEKTAKVLAEKPKLAK